MSLHWFFALPLLAVGFLTIGQKPIKCKHQNPKAVPSYKVGWHDYNVEGPKTLFLAVSVRPRHFSKDEMVALAHRLNQDFCHEQRLNAALLDDYKAARAFSPTNERQWFYAHWRGQYLLDRDSGKEEITFSTAANKPRDEVRLNLSSRGEK
ncbi:MAG TPA: hypothetical protein VK582_11390 [Pyrinomonadaceae bacterium]|nr:hypothetical protein [Pyrinomonadaceae bacterium]